MPRRGSQMHKKFLVATKDEGAIRIDLGPINRRGELGGGEGCDGMAEVVEGVGKREGGGAIGTSKTGRRRK